MRTSVVVGFWLLATLFGTWACSSSTNPMTSTYVITNGGSNGQSQPSSDWTTTPNKAAALYAVWGGEADDVWAVGYENNIVHWNGTAWSSSLSGTTGELRSVWGARANDVWAGGANGEMLHWDGRAWTSQTLSGSYGYSSYITGIWGSSANDVWAVGGGEYDDAFVLHWDGIAWTRTDIATSASGLNAVWGSAPNDVWAVGGGTMGSKGVIVHWDGQSWSKVMEGSSTVSLFGMFGVWGSAANDVWAVGVENLAHWDGISWNLEHCTGQAADYTVGATVSTCPYGFLGVWGNATNDVWAVAEALSGGAGFIEHWNGTSWTMNDMGMTNGTDGIWGTGPNNIWVVGPLVLQGGVIMHYTK